MERQRRGIRSWSERREAVLAYEGSGLSQRAFCQQTGMAPSTLRKWCRQVAQADGSQSGPEAVARLLPVAVQSEVAVVQASGVSLVTDHGVRIEVCAGFDSPTLQRVVAALDASA